MSTFYVTTPIYYVNARPHLGHAYTTIVADTMKRFYIMLGHDAYMLTGTDEHGDKIVKAATAVQKSPKEFVDEISSEFATLWKDLEIEHDQFIRTTDENHKKSVQALLQRIYDKGDIYHGEYGGHYCFGCERFYTEKELEDGLCPQHQTKPEFISEKNYFFKMSKYQDWLRQHILDNPDFIRPERYRNEVLSMLEGNVLEDLCISRPKTRLEWGIELPFDTEYVCYVWFDALANYISALGWPHEAQNVETTISENVEIKNSITIEKNGDLYTRYWPAEHLVAKDILKPHGIFWSTMLKAAEIPLFKHLNVHGYWLVKDTKMSKSLGNVVDPKFAAEHFGMDAFRYFLLREMHFGSDASYSEEAMINRINSDLANDLGNLFSRVLSMNAKYFSQKIPALGDLSAEDEELFALTENATLNFTQLFKEVRFSQALDSLWEPVRYMNKYVDSQAPWTLYKEGNIERLGTVIRVLMENMYKVCYLMYPVMPKSSMVMQEQLGKKNLLDNNNVALNAKHLEDLLSCRVHLRTGEEVANASNLFPRLEKVKIADEKENVAKKQKNKISKNEKDNKLEKSADKVTGAVMNTKESAQEAEIEGKPFIEYADFQKLDLRLGTIIKADRHPDADKLLRFDVDLGEETPRQIISGIAEFFTPENLIGRKVVVVANLPPRKLRGLVSHGMILTAEHEGKLDLLTADMQNGATIS